MKQKHLRITYFLIGVVFTFSLMCQTPGFAQDDDFLHKYETGDLEFVRVEVGTKIVYYHQRMIDEAIVEKDFIVYQFDKATGDLLDKKVHWRPGLPEHVKLNFDQAHATAAVQGEVLWAQLFIISPDSDVFPLEITPTNPCWVIKTLNPLGNTDVTIIDAVNGQYLGQGVPPPSREGFTLTGPEHWDPCRSGWYNHVNNAITWFNTMGYSTTNIDWPTQPEVQAAVQDPWTYLFFEMGHGGSASFCSGCSGGNWCENTSSASVNTWITDYPKKVFTFIGSCDGMCDTGPNTLSDSFRKGFNHNTVTVGYCGMGTSHCDPTCWHYTVPWQDAFFDYLNGGDTFQEAFNNAQADYPMCAATPSCLRFAGDTTLKLRGYDLCFADSTAAKHEFDFIDYFWLVGNSSTACGLCDLTGWGFGSLYAFAVDVDSTVSSCHEGVFYFGHTGDLSYRWINTVGHTGSGYLMPCLSNPTLPESSPLKKTPEKASEPVLNYCFQDNYGSTYNFSLPVYPGGFYIRGEATLVFGGTYPMIGATEGGIFSWYVDMPTDGTDIEGIVFAGFVDTLSGVFRFTNGFQGPFSLTPCQ